MREEARGQGSETGVTNTFAREVIGYVERPGGHRIRYGIHLPEGGNFSRAIVFLNGRAEWMEKYIELPLALKLPPDTAYLSMDHRGQGGSTGDRAWIDTYDTFVDDVKAVLDNVLGSSIPYSILAHSTGGLVAVYGVLRKKLRPEAMVFSSPLLGLRHKPMRPLFGWPLMELASLTPLYRWNMPFERHVDIGFERNKLTRDRRMFERICATPYPMPGPSCGWVRASYRAIHWIHSRARLQGWSVPTLIMASRRDRIVNPLATGVWVERVREYAQAPVELFWEEDSYHELFAEVPEVFDASVRKAREWLSRFFFHD
jgi:lysophospholipase